MTRFHVTSSGGLVRIYLVLAKPRSVTRVRCCNRRQSRRAKLVQDKSALEEKRYFGVCTEYTCKCIQQNAVLLVLPTGTHNFIYLYRLRNRHGGRYDWCRVWSSLQSFEGNSRQGLLCSSICFNKMSTNQITENSPRKF